MKQYEPSEELKYNIQDQAADAGKVKTVRDQKAPSSPKLGDKEKPDKQSPNSPGKEDTPNTNKNKGGCC